MQLPLINNLTLKNLKRDEYRKYFDLIPDFKQEKTQKYTSIILTLITSILLGIFALGPTLSTITTLQKQLEDDKFVEKKLSEKINNLSLLQQAYSGLENDLPIVFAAVPKKSEIPLLLASVQGLAKESNVTLINFQTFPTEVSDRAVSAKKFSSYDFNLTIKGDYQNMIIFMDRLVNFQRVTTVGNIAISKTVEISVVYLQLNIRGTAYFKQ
nr:type 4a pilus biogenesis protein PilO [Candidatus Levybacteria bacterium]